MGKFKSKTAGYAYYMTLLMGICRGPVDAVLQVKVGDRTTWSGKITKNESVRINKRNLFGGPKGEGGIEGHMDVLMGEPDQENPHYPGMGEDQGAFRGVLMVMYDGLVSMMTPYPKQWKFLVRRNLKGWDGPVWYAEKAIIKMTGYDDEGNASEIYAQNACHILYECLTNRVWGRGLPRDMILEADWRYAADMLYEEEFGLCLMWRRQDTLESFIQMILDHIGAALYVDKFTGKQKLKLIRRDFDPDTLPVFTSSSGLLDIEEATNGAIAGLTNEVVVKYTNPITSKDNQVRAHNLALIQTAKCTISDTRTYEGCPTGLLATRLAERDLRAASTNVRRFKLICDRRGWKIQPGDVIKIADPETRGIENVIVRIVETEEGGISDGKIVLSGVQDTFTFNMNTFTDVQRPEYVEPDRNPKLARRKIYEATYAEILSLFPPAEFEALRPSYGFLMAHAEKGTPLSMGFDVNVYNPNKGEFLKGGAGDFSAVATLVADIGYLDNIIGIKEGTSLDEVEVGNIIYIDEELMLIRAVHITGGGGTLEVGRGVYDTVPARHQAGATVWDTVSGRGSDYTTRQGGESIDVKLLPWTLSSGPFPVDLAPFDTLKFNWRIYRPYAPGLVQIDSAEAPTKRWYEGHAMRADVGASEIPDFMRITWTHRDRPFQADKAIDHEQESIGPEPTTTYRIKILDTRGKLIRAETGISGTEFLYTYGQAALDLDVESGTTESANGFLQLESMRDGFESWQHYTIPFTVYKKPPQVVEVANQASIVAQREQELDDSENPNPDGFGDVYLANQATIVAQVGGDDVSGEHIDNLRGVNVAGINQSISQGGVIVPTIDKQIFETPYTILLREGKDTDPSQYMTVVARPSDRVSDGYDLFERERNSGDFINFGERPWTPWATLKTGISHLANEIEFHQTSEADGVPVGDVQVGDLIFIDKEILCVTKVGDRKLTVDRGCVDTVPAVHYQWSVIWFSKHHAASDVIYPASPDGKVGVQVAIRAHSEASTIPVTYVDQRQLMSLSRANRPFPPGFVIGNGEHVFTYWNALADDHSYYAPKAKDLVVTWAHRNKEIQGEDAVGHLASGIKKPNNVHYRVWVGYRYSRKNGDSFDVTCGTFFTEDNGITIPAETLAAWGASRARSENPTIKGSTGLTITIQAVDKDTGLNNWQGYATSVVVPALAGKKDTDPKDPWRPGPNEPGGDNGGNTGGGNDGGETNPGDPDPSKPPVKPPPEVENPDPEKPPETVDPVVPPEEIKVPGWSYEWDHGWAENIPQQPPTED